MSLKSFLPLAAFVVLAPLAYADPAPTAAPGHDQAKHDCAGKDCHDKDAHNKDAQGKDAHGAKGPEKKAGLKDCHNKPGKPGDKEACHKEPLKPVPPQH